jgi:hypothetical protein
MLLHCTAAIPNIHTQERAATKLGKAQGAQCTLAAAAAAGYFTYLNIVEPKLAPRTAHVAYPSYPTAMLAACLHKQGCVVQTNTNTAGLLMHVK